MQYFMILIGVFIASFGLTVIASKYGPHKNLKHIIGVLIAVGFLYDGYLMLFVPYQGFQDIVRILFLVFLGVALAGYAGALIWIKVRVKFRKH